MDAGEYVPDEVTNAMVADRLSQPDAADGFLLDGYPRTDVQVAELDRMLGEAGRELDAVVELTASTDEVVSRLLGRAAEQGRSDDTEDVIRRRLEVYAEQTAPLTRIYAERGLLVQVTEDVIRRRLEVYAEQTAPLTRIYAERGLLVQVDGMGEVPEVTERITAALAEKTSGHAAG